MLQGRKRKPKAAAHLEESQMLVEFGGEVLHGNLKEAMQRMAAEEDSKEEIICNTYS